jgi:hypothetical protein
MTNRWYQPSVGIAPLGAGIAVLRMARLKSVPVAP